MTEQDREAVDNCSYAGAEECDGLCEDCEYDSTEYEEDDPDIDIDDDDDDDYDEDYDDEDMED